MRDKFAKFAEDDLLERRITSLEKRYEGKDVLEFFKGMYLDDARTRVDDDGFRDLRFLLSNLLSVQTKFIPLKFSRGDELAKIYDLNFSEMVNHYHYLSEELSKGHPDKVIYGYADEVRAMPAQYSVYVWLAWSLCFETDFDKIKSILPHLCAPGQDRLTDRVCASFIEDWPIADGCGYENVFGLLDQVISSSSSEERVKIVKSYLENWPKYIGQVEGAAIGFNASTASRDINSLDDLLKSMNDHYVGFWSWEVALVVKFLGIDDSSFKDSDFYPYDLVHFTPSLSDQGFVVGEFGELNMVATTTEPKVLAEQRKDLTIKLERDSFDSAELKEDSNPELYHAYLPKKGVSVTEGFDFIDDSAVRYCAYVTKNADEIAVAKDELNLVKSVDDWLVKGRLEKNVNELTDECGTSEMYPSMEEVFLRLDNDYTNGALIYCSRHKDGEIPPLMILRYAKFFEDQMLFIYCMVRDSKLTYNDVAGHWLWCIDRYSELEL